MNIVKKGRQKLVKFAILHTLSFNSRKLIGSVQQFMTFYLETFSRENYLPAGNYMFKVNNRNTRTRCEICSKLTIKTPERC